MNYEVIYNNFINSRLNRKLDKKIYYEKHHIKPKSLGGLDDDNNIIKLTAREHYFAHLLLSKFAGPKMVIALSFFICKNNKHGGGVKYKPSSRKIAIIIENANHARSKLLKGRNISDEHRKKLSNAMKGRTPPNKGTKKTKEAIKKQSDSMKGRIPWNKGLTGNDFIVKSPNHVNPPNMTGYKWINNGLVQSKLAPNKILPEGWSYGRLDNRGDNNGMRKKNK